MDCRHEMQFRSGTVMQGSRLPVRDWFATMFLLTTTKRAISAKEIQRQFGRKHYQPVWEMVHKLRDVMGRRDGCSVLHEDVEIDEGFFSTETPEEQKDCPLKRGRGSQRKTVVTDNEKSVGKVLPWVHIAISNAKRSILDTYHDIKAEFLQLYLNEFCYKFNRRYFGFRSLTDLNFALACIGRSSNIESIDWQLADIHFILFCCFFIRHTRHSFHEWCWPCLFSASRE